MFALRSLRLAARPLVHHRGYAEAAAGAFKLSLVLPHETIFKGKEVFQVNISADAGDMGLLSNHVASIESLKPGMLEVFEGPGPESQKWFVSGGFANMNPDNTLTVNCVEAYPLDAFSPEAIRSGLAEAQRVAAGAGSEVEKAEARVEVEVFEAIQQSMTKV